MVKQCGTLSTARRPTPRCPTFHSAKTNSLLLSTARHSADSPCWLANSISDPDSDSLKARE